MTRVVIERKKVFVYSVEPVRGDRGWIADVDDELIARWQDAAVEWDAIQELLAMTPRVKP